jgi:DNA-binding SARP family transcriptional activator
MEFRLLGAFEVWDGGQPVEVAGAKRRALLALLVLRANEVVRGELLVDELWGERPPRNAAAALRTHVSRLRKTLGADTIASREWGYVLRAAPAEVDLRRFEGLVADAEPLAARERASKLAEALALWRGPPLADLVNEPALQRDIARLEELRLSTLERRIDADLEAGNANVVGELETLVAQQPLREHLRWLLILALYRAGRQAEALEVYRETRRVLTEELGLEPSPALKELEQAILRQDPSLEANAPPTRTEPPAMAQESKRRRLPPVALLALLALGLAGTATAIALVRPQKSASGGTTEVISEMLPTTTTHHATDSHATTDGQKTTVKNHTTTSRTHTTSSSATTSTKPATTSATQPTTPVANTRQQKNKQVPPPKAVTIADTFNGAQVNPAIWHEVTDGGEVSIVEQGGQLNLTIGAGAVPGGTYNQIDVHVGTQCSFPANFDARVDYKLLEWPAGDNIDVGLNAVFANAAIMRDRSSQLGDEYTSWAYPSKGSVATSDTGGSLRIARVNGIETTYFLHSGRWRALASSHESGKAVLALQAFSDGQNPFGGQELKVAFDNFKVTGVTSACA